MIISRIYDAQETILGKFQRSQLPRFVGHENVKLNYLN